MLFEFDSCDGFAALGGFVVFMGRLGSAPAWRPSQSEGTTTVFIAGIHDLTVSVKLTMRQTARASRIRDLGIVFYCSGPVFEQ